MSKPFPHYRQPDSKDCGPTCLRMIARYYGKPLPLQQIRQLSETTREGSSLLGLSEAAEKIGFRTLGVKLSFSQLLEADLPCVLHWNQNHFVVLYKIVTAKNRWLFKRLATGYRNKNVKACPILKVSDPAHGLLSYTPNEFLKSWIGKNANEQTREGIALLLEPTPDFYKETPEAQESKPNTYGFPVLAKYTLRHKRFLWQLVFGLLAGSLLQLIFPFLTQSVVDVGIRNRDLHFIYLVLFAQLFLFLGRTAVEVIRSWILLHLSTRINIALVSDFFIKLMSLPIAFFDTRMTGDILQRINDHKRIEQLLTTSSLNVLFSLFNLIIFGLVLVWYNLGVFLIFVVGSLAYFGWILFFFKKRRDLDYKRFSQMSREQSKVIELINGMQEIKLHNAEMQKRWGWEFLQVKLFKVSIKGLALEQYQSVGSNFINELKNILITVLAAKLVIDGSITLGMMLAITYIVGQLNAPVSQLIGFMRELQDARISLERLGEIHGKEDEFQQNLHTLHQVPENAGLIAKNVTFKYTGGDKPVLKKLNLEIPANHITAIVGSSGSGKTTLLKLLLKFYEPQKGVFYLTPSASLKGIDLKNLSQKTWREHCGVVMQEGYIFNDTIANNIAIGETQIDHNKLLQAVDTANIKDFIEGLPLSYNTHIGMEGVGLSTGQKQRILIARAVYKNPKYLFFDEATSALDANNEKDIMLKLQAFFENKTVVVVAHRLSTVKNAHQIVVLEKGKIVEIGNHNELVAKQGFYFNLVKNQLELGN